MPLDFCKFGALLRFELRILFSEERVLLPTIDATAPSELWWTSGAAGLMSAEALVVNVAEC